LVTRNISKYVGFTLTLFGWVDYNSHIQLHSTLSLATLAVMYFGSDSESAAMRLTTVKEE